MARESHVTLKHRANATAGERYVTGFMALPACQRLSLHDHRTMHHSHRRSIDEGFLFRTGSRIQPQGLAARFACPIVIGCSRVLTSSLVRSPDITENWRKIGPTAARRGKSFAGRSTMFESTRLLPAWGDNPKIRPYIEIVEFV
jgi:hypothetical protein